MKTARAAGVLSGLALVTVIAGAREREASACGGCFTPPPVTQVESVITDEKMIFSISQTQTTLFDEIEYSGAPSSFAWVLPIKGPVTVGLSADILFATMEQLTATAVVVPTVSCPPPPICSAGGGPQCGSETFSLPSGAVGASGPGARAGSVTVLGQQQVGPYETVQLHSNDGSALDHWLHAHGYRIPASDATVIAAYVAEHFDFLALKLIPGQGVKAMQPVRVTSMGAAPQLPLHMVAVGTGATTGITIWVVADGRWEPGNFPTFMIDDSEITWDWATSSSNYETVRLAKEAVFKGRGWQIESSLDINKQRVRYDVLDAQNSGAGGYTLPTNGGGGSGDAGGPDAGVEGGAGEAGGPDADVEGGAGEAGSETATLSEVVNADIDVLFAGTGRFGPTARVTRMRSDVAHAALSEDMFLRAAADQSELTNLHHPKQHIGQPQCPVYDENCIQIGTAPRDQAVADANGGCSTTRSPSGWRTSVALVVTALGLGVLRNRRRRRRR